MDGYRVGMILANKWAGLKHNMLWSLPGFRKRLDEARKKRLEREWDKPKKPFWSEFFKGWKNNKKIRWVHCDGCGAVGFDWRSEDYGWKYEGHHYWSCPKCKGDEDGNKTHDRSR